MFLTSYALCSFKFFKLKTEGQTTKQTISPKLYRTEIKILTIQPGLGDDTDRMISGILTLCGLNPRNSVVFDPLWISTINQISDLTMNSHCYRLTSFEVSYRS